MKMTLGVIAAGLVLAAASAAQAGVIITQIEFSSDTTIVCDSYTPPPNEFHTWTWDEAGGTMTDDEHLIVDAHTYTFSTDADPVFHIVETITNHTGLAWRSYIIDLTGAGNSLSHPTASPDLTTGVVSNGGLRITYTGAHVPVNGVETLAFDLTLPDTGGFFFNFTLTGTAVPVAVPEPAALGVLGLGVAGALVRRRRAR